MHRLRFEASSTRICGKSLTPVQTHLLYWISKTSSLCSRGAAIAQSARLRAPRLGSHCRQGIFLFSIKSRQGLGTVGYIAVGPRQHSHSLFRVLMTVYCSLTGLEILQQWDRLWGPPSLLYNGHGGAVSPWLKQPDVKLTIRLHAMTRSRMVEI
jgi:hypothetical protein